MYKVVFLALFVCFISSPVCLQAVEFVEVHNRVEHDVAAGKPIVLHVIVALCDNEHQGIVPVNKSLGNGQNPRTNLYWGAAFGFETYLKKHGGYTLVAQQKNPVDKVLKVVQLRKELSVSGKKRTIEVTGEAWDGRYMKDAIMRYLKLSAGWPIGYAGILEKNNRDPHLVVFIGHNGLMDFQLTQKPKPNSKSPARSSMILACASKPYFEDLLVALGAHPLVMTTGLMAPEAYTLDAVIDAFVAGKGHNDIKIAAAAAYHQYQKCGLKNAKRLFSAN